MGNRDEDKPCICAVFQSYGDDQTHIVNNIVRSAVTGGEDRFNSGEFCL